MTLEFGGPCYPTMVNRDFNGETVEAVEDGYPRHTIRGEGGRARFARFCLKLAGWKVDGPPPVLNKYVIVAAPHTTWFDGFWMLAFAWHWGIHLNWMGKISLTKGPLGWLPLRAGLVPVDRSKPQGLVAQMAEEFEARETILLAIPPEGTRAKRDYWKSGFIQIAKAAEVPICMSYLDYKNRVAGFGPVFVPGEEVGETMDKMRAFYRAEWSKNPNLFTPPRLREEDVVVKLETRERSELEPLLAAGNE